MRILVVHNRYRSTSPGGEDRVVDQETAALREAGHDVELFQRESDTINERSVTSRLAVPFEVVWSAASKRSLEQVLRSFRPHVVHVHNTFPLLSASVLYACRRERVPVVATLHNYRLVCPSGDLFRDGRVCHDCVELRVPLPGVVHGCYRGSRVATLPLATSLVLHRRSWQRLVAGYIVLSSAQRELVLHAGLDPSRVFVKSNFVQSAVPAHTTARPEVVYAGRLTEAKGLRLLMDAWDRFHEGRTPASEALSLAIAGAGPLGDEIATWAAPRPSVRFLGMLGREECAAVVAGARAVVVPSRWEETFGLVAVEAMAVGVPPIAPTHGSFPDLISDGIDGVLFDALDPDALAKLFHEVAIDPGRFEALGEAARETFRKRFQKGPNVDQLLGVYRFAVDNPV